MKYIGYFTDNVQERLSFPAGQNKMRYIANVIAKKVPVEILSCSGVNGKETACGRVTAIEENVSLRLFFSLGRKNKIVGKFSTVLTKALFFTYLLFHVQKNEKVIVYHSMGYARIIYYLKKIKKFYLILEMEELYSDVDCCENDRLLELELTRVADAFIFPTALLSNVANQSHKPEIVVHGTYDVEPNRECNVFSMELQNVPKRTIHCVYAGTFDPRKGGAIAAAAAAEFLPFGYHIHILGFGSENERKNMQDIVEKISKKTKSKVTYDGLLTGENYIRFIQSCDIGLSTQNPDAAFNATSFPSKILSYMANGLRVVSIRIPVIEQSAIGDMLYYYDEQTPEKIAKAILAVNMQEEYDSRKMISKLDKEFQKNMCTLLEI